MNKGSPVSQSRGDLGPSFEAEGTARAEDAEREEPGVSAAQTRSGLQWSRWLWAGGGGQLGNLCQEHLGRLYELFPSPTVFGLTVT